VTFRDLSLVIKTEPCILYFYRMSPPSETIAVENESARLALLESLALLDTPPEPEFDAIAGEAALLTGYDTALVTLMGANRCWFKASAGILAGAGMLREIPRGLTYCQHALGSSGLFVVSDGLSDARVSHLASVRGPDGFRAYAGVQLIMAEGLSVGSLCVLNRLPRTPTADDHATLRRLAERTLQLLAGRRRANEPVSVRDTLLIADDERGIRSLLADLFEHRGVRTLVACDGAEALRLYHENAPRVAVVLTDLHMPGINGLTLVRTLSDQPGHPVCVVMSGHLGPSDQRDLIAAGVRKIFRKPFSLLELEFIHELIGAPGKPLRG